MIVRQSLTVRTVPVKLSVKDLKGRDNKFKYYSYTCASHMVLKIIKVKSIKMLVSHEMLYTFQSL